MYTGLATFTLIGVTIIFFKKEKKNEKKVNIIRNNIFKFKYEFIAIF